MCCCVVSCSPSRAKSFQCILVCDLMNTKSSSTYWSLFRHCCARRPTSLATTYDQILKFLTFMRKDYHNTSDLIRQSVKAAKWQKVASLLHLPHPHLWTYLTLQPIHLIQLLLHQHKFLLPQMDFSETFIFCIKFRVILLITGILNKPRASKALTFLSTDSSCLLIMRTT